MADKELEATAYHEAGHAVMHHIEGDPATSVTIEPDGNVLGLTAHRGLPEWVRRAAEGLGMDADKEEEAEKYIEREVRIFFAGGIAEKRYRNGVYNEVGAGGDLGAIADYLCYYHGTVELIKNAADRLHLEAKDTILSAKWWPRVKAVAERLLEDRTLSGSELRQIIGKAP